MHAASPPCSRSGGHPHQSGSFPSASIHLQRAGGVGVGDPERRASFWRSRAPRSARNAVASRRHQLRQDFAVERSRWRNPGACSVFWLSSKIFIRTAESRRSMSSILKRGLQIRTVVAELPLRDLSHSSLRMRPDRIIIGEIRGGEALDLDSGHDQRSFWLDVHPGIS